MGLNYKCCLRPCLQETKEQGLIQDFSVGGPLTSFIEVEVCFQNSLYTLCISPSFLTLGGHNNLGPSYM